MFFNKFFYNIKPFVPRRLQIFIRRRLISYKLKRNSHVWPIDSTAGTPPKGWQGWPNNKKIALVLSHDVDTQKGHDQCYQLMEIEDKLGFRSSFNFVPEKYSVSETLINDIKNRGFEVCVHGLNHDGKLFFSRKIFNHRAKRINHYLREWGSNGFTSPSMLCNLDWMHALNISHSTSTFDTDPFEPQQNPVGTIFPLWVPNSSGTMRPSENVQFCSTSKEENILTGDIQTVFRGLKYDSDPGEIVYAPMKQNNGFIGQAFHPNETRKRFHRAGRASEEIEQKGTFCEDLKKGYVELPYTLPQDFTLFILMKEQNIDIWKEKLHWIAEKGGMALFNSHPDYMNFNKPKNGNEEYNAELYIEFLEYIKNRYKDQYWHALPKDIARFWQQNYSL